MIEEKQEDPLAIVRESRLRMSHREGNDPVRVIKALRTLQAKYAPQIEKYRKAPAMVAEEQAVYGHECDSVP